MTEGKAAFATLNWEVDKTKQPTKAQEYWISLETWRLADRWSALQRAGGASSKEVRKARREFCQSL